MEFSSVTISFFIHSTEDEDRLLKAVENKFALEPEEVATEKITGHFGNDMISVRAHLVGERAQETATRIVESLAKNARNSIRAELQRSLDEHDSLYLRLDRQTFGESSLSLSDEEPIRIKLKPKVRSGGRQSMAKQYEELMR